MAHYFSFSRFAAIALVGTIMTGSLVGCQQSTSTADSEEATEEHAEHAHEEHGHDEEHEEHSHTEHAHGEHEEHGHDEYEGHKGHDHASNSIPFSCEPTATIGVSYHNDVTPQTAHLLIDGIEYDLTATTDSNVNTDKAIYTSDIGLDETHGIIWQVNGDRATLLNKTLDSNVAIEEEDVLFDCQKS